MTKRLLYNLPAILIVMALASGLTYLLAQPALVQGWLQSQNAKDQSAIQENQEKSSEVKEEAKPEEKPQKTQPVAEEAPDVKTATIRNEVNLRASMSTESQILAVIPPGAIVTLLPEENASWQHVSYQGISGYVAKSFLSY